jgi:hypothetical protein
VPVRQTVGVGRRSDPGELIWERRRSVFAFLTHDWDFEQPERTDGGLVYHRQALHISIKYWGRLQGLRDLLPNLQLLEMSVNISKSASPPATWANSLYPSPDARQAYLERNEIPWLPSAPGEFEAFFTERRKALAQRIARLLGTGATAATGEGAAQAADVAGTIDDELAVSDDE